MYVGKKTIAIPTSCQWALFQLSGEITNDFPFFFSSQMHLNMSRLAVLGTSWVQELELFPNY